MAAGGRGGTEDSRRPLDSVGEEKVRKINLMIGGIAMRRVGQQERGSDKGEKGKVRGCGSVRRAAKLEHEGGEGSEQRQRRQ